MDRRSDRSAKLYWCSSSAIVTLGIAIGGGCLIALTSSLCSNVYLLVGIAVGVGMSIAVSAYRVDVGGWQGYLIRVASAGGCALISGICSGGYHWILCLLLNSVLKDPWIVNCATHTVRATLFVGLFTTTITVLVAAVFSGRKGASP